MQVFNGTKPKLSIHHQSGLLKYQPLSSLKVISVSNLSASTYILRLERKGITFIPGQHISLGEIETRETREYSIYSGVNDNYIEVLIKEVEDGLVSKRMRQLQPGNLVRFDGPFGYFRLPETGTFSKKYLFIASGTGIAPFHSFIRSYPGIDYKLLHGIRYLSEAYEKNTYGTDHYIRCISGADTGDFHGRVTAYLESTLLEKELYVYICGNSAMIHDVYGILLDKGIRSEQIHSEVYF